MDGAAAGKVAGQRMVNLASQFLDGFMDAATGGGTRAFNGQKGLGQGHFDLAGIERGDFAIATNNAVTPWCCCRDIGFCDGGLGRRCCGCGVRVSGC